MKQITLHVYQSLDGCPVGADKHFDAAADASCCVLIDEETYLRIYLNHLGWPLTAKETLVVTGRLYRPDREGTGAVCYRGCGSGTAENKSGRRRYGNGLRSGNRGFALG